MRLRFFADHCVPKSAVDSLQQDSHEVFRLKDFIPQDSPDPHVIAAAQNLDAILISLNGDFADIVAYPPADFKGIVALQVRNRPQIISDVMAILTRYLSKNPDMAHYKGKLLVVESYRIRVRE